MRDYGRLAPTFWTRGSGKRLRGNAIAQVVAAYLCSAPGSNAIGLYYLPIVVIAHDTGLTVPQVEKALQDIEAVGFAFYDASVDLVFLPNGAEYQIGERLTDRDRRRSMIEKDLRRFSGHRFVQMFLDRYSDAYTLAPFANKFCKPIPELGMAIPELGMASDPDPLSVSDLISDSDARVEPPRAVAPEPPPDPPSGVHRVSRPDPAGESWIASAFSDGVAESKCGRVAAPRGGVLRALLDIEAAHGPTLPLEARLARMRGWAKAFAEANRGKALNVYKFGDWMSARAGAQSASDTPHPSEYEDPMPPPLSSEERQRSARLLAEALAKAKAS